MEDAEPESNVNDYERKAKASLVARTTKSCPMIRYEDSLVGAAKFVSLLFIGIG
jgi:hypothetical protein